MSRVLAPSPEFDFQAFTHFLRSDKLFAIGVAVLMHVMVMALLLAGWQENKPVAVKVNTIKVQMIQAPVVIPAAEKVPVQPPIQTQPESPVIEKTPIKKEPPKQTVQEAKFTKKRIDEPKIATLDSLPEIIEKTEVPPTDTAVPLAAAKQTSQSSANFESAPRAVNETPPDQPFDSSQYFPVQKDAPAYPSRALDKGVEGICTVRYTVNTEGRVENPEVLDDCHAFFIKPSLAATKSFRYTPRMVNGIAVSVPNVKNTFQYRIE